MNNNIFQMKLNTKYEERIYVIRAEATTLYQILFLKGNQDAQLNQISQFRHSSPYLIILLNTYTDLEERIYKTLFLYRS